MEINDNITMDQKSTPIQSFYKDTNIFITGGTGFLGRVLIEKLLRSCPDISAIYLLVRNKKGKNLEERVDELFEDVFFGELKKINPKFRHKVVPIEGDCCLPQIGLKDQDVETLVKKVNVVFHAAATVRFDEKLNIAVTINVKAPLYLMELAHQMMNLKSFVHISTAYTNCIQPIIEEKLYPPPMEYKELIALTENVNETLICSMTDKIIGEWPNTYAFTKAVAENAVEKHGSGLPVAIFRPSIILSTYKEPIPAWINNIYGPTGICAGAGVGLVRAVPANPSVNGNMVPVDMCVNSIIAVAWETAKKFKKNEEADAKTEIPVYHFETSTDQPITWGKFMELNSTYGPQFATVKAMWCYSLTLFKYELTYLVATFFLHLLPAFIIDLFLVVIGRQPMMLKIYKKIHKFLGVIAYFSLRNFKFKSENVKSMISTMTQKDREIFFCDLRELDWNQYFRVYMKGLRIYILNDDISTVDKGKVLYRRFYLLHITLQVVLILIALRVSWFLGSSLHGIMFT